MFSRYSARKVRKSNVERELKRDIVLEIMKEASVEFVNSPDSQFRYTKVRGSIARGRRMIKIRARTAFCIQQPRGIHTNHPVYHMFMDLTIVENIIDIAIYKVNPKGSKPWHKISLYDPQSIEEAGRIVKSTIEETAGLAETFWISRFS